MPTTPVPPAFPNYFELFQNIANPFMANAAPNAAAAMTAMLDPKELERKAQELQTVLMWLKAQVGLVEMSLQTLEYQKSFATQMAAASGSGGAGGTGGTGGKGGNANAADIAELAKTAAAMNPAQWAWNLMQQATEQAPVPTAEKAPRAKAKRKR